MDTVKTGRDTVAWYPNITPTGDSLYFTLLAWRIRIPPSGFRFPSIPGPVVHDTIPGKRDTIIVIRVDTVRVPVNPPSPNAHAPELPRGMAAMDSMLKMARAIDTMNTASWPHIRQDSTGKWVCYLNCTPAALARVKTMNATKPKTTAPKKFVPPKKEPVGEAA